MQKQVSTTEY